jgi:formate hydrogenlyase subunit 4
VGAGWEVHLLGFATWIGKLAVAGALLAVFEIALAKMRVFRVPAFLAAAFMMAILGALLLFVSRGGLT